jgi:hypothetical protein
MLKIIIDTMTMLTTVNTLLRGRLDFILGMILTRP